MSRARDGDGIDECDTDVLAISEKLSIHSINQNAGSTIVVHNNNTALSTLPSVNTPTNNIHRVKSCDSIRSHHSNSSVMNAKMFAGCSLSPSNNLLVPAAIPISNEVANTATSASVSNPLLASPKSREVSHNSSFNSTLAYNAANMDGLAFFNNGTNSLRLNTGNLRTAHLSTMMAVIQDPVQCGFLLEFCTRQHNSENLCFIMMVSRLRDAMSTDAKAWPKSWSQIDAECLAKANSTGAPIDSIDTDWPSKTLSKVAISKLVQTIWDNFLSDDATHQICMSSQVSDNTKRRIQLLCLYGPEVYTEALIDPIKTINKDVLPRFLASPLYADMKLRLASLTQKSSTAKLVVPSPDKMALLEKKTEIFHEKRLFSLHEILENRVLYNQFLSHLQKKMSVENLLCYRMILIFEEQMTAISEMHVERDSPTKVEAVNQAWTIYRYFVAPDSPYEVSLHSRHKKEIMISLACPYHAMFDELKKSTYSVLTVNFNAFKFTDEYRCLWKVMREARGGLAAMLVGSGLGLGFTLPTMIRANKK